MIINIYHKVIDFGYLSTKGEYYSGNLFLHQSKNKKNKQIIIIKLNQTLMVIR